MDDTDRTTWPTPACGSLEGPWEQAFYFHVPGQPMSKSNHRHDATHRAAWAAMKSYGDLVATAARAGRPRGWLTGNPTESVSDRPVVVACLFARTMLDAGNLDKSVLDAVAGTPAKGRAPATAGVVMASDAQVRSTHSWVVRAAADPGLLALFARLRPGAGPWQVAAAAVELTRACEQLLTPAR